MTNHQQAVKKWEREKARLEALKDNAIKTACAWADFGSGAFDWDHAPYHHYPGERIHVRGYGWACPCKAVKLAEQALVLLGPKPKKSA